MINTMKNNKKGFTLIEVLIVVSIIGILASIVLVGLGAFRTRGRDTRRLADIRQIQGGLELYYSKFGSYPLSVTFGALQTALQGATIGITKIPDDPSVGKHYLYKTDSGGTGYVLAATIEDAGNPALNDDIDAVPGTYTTGDTTLTCTDPQYCVQF